ncbi:MAG: hypothetical protein PHV74_08280 [Dehalococcoidia bacterium]|nr:hypothetical protein [Dehalococcoidia bacterium]
MTQSEFRYRLFAGTPWMDAIAAKSRVDQEYLKKAKGLTTSQRMVVMDAPGGVDILSVWEWDDGKVVKHSRQEKPAPSEWRSLKNEEPYNSTTMGTYKNLSKMARGEMNAQVAMAKGLYAVHGNMLKIFPKMGKFSAFTDLVKTIPCEY